MSHSAEKLLSTVLVKLCSNSNRSVTEAWKTYCKTYQVDCKLATINGIRFGRSEDNSYETGFNFRKIGYFHGQFRVFLMF